MNIDRKTFLRGTGGAAMALPFLEIMAKNKKDLIPKRMVCVGVYFGFVPKLFFPNEAGKNYKLSELLNPLAAHRKDFTVFQNLDHGLTGGHQAVHTFLSGVKSIDAKNMPEGNISIDQKAAEFVGVKTRYSSLQLTTGGNSGNSLSWSRSGVSLPPIKSLKTIYSLLFEKPNKQRIQQIEHGLKVDKSILDLVKIDADRLKKQLGRDDLDKLDQYFTSVEELERKLSMSQLWLEKEKPMVSYKLPTDADARDFKDRLSLYYKLIALALQTDSTRVISFEISDLGANSGGLNLTTGYHNLTHHGKKPEFLKELKLIEMTHTAAFADFLKELKMVKEANGKTLLDNTMTLLGSGMGNASSHSNKSLPLLLAGGGFNHGDSKIYKPGTAACNLYLNMLQNFGLEVDQFNLSTGTLNGFGVS